MKKHLKAFIVWVMWSQVDRFRTRHNPVVIAVAGSVGKTGTKQAISTVLREAKNVRFQAGNYNDIVSVPLVFFGLPMPSLYNPIGWLKVLIKTESQIRGNAAPDIVVLEIGTDYDGNMDEFVTRLKVDYGVLTAISAEHMVNFKDMDAVASEELKLTDMADTLLANADQINPRYLKRIPDALLYGDGSYDCSINPSKLTKELYRPVSFSVRAKNKKVALKTRLIGRQNLSGLAAATLLGFTLDLSERQVTKGLEKVSPFEGRMNLLLGKRQSLLIDDTYNASPEAVIAALETVYELPNPHKIAVLGQMNELGKFSKAHHQQVGKACDPTQLDLVVTIGNDANTYLADTAEKNGCKVVRCPSPYHAGDIVRPLLQKGTVVLLKGSQNGVFAEEATKELLQRRSDAGRLVRQSPRWLKIKAGQFTHE